MNRRLVAFVLFCGLLIWQNGWAADDDYSDAEWVPGRLIVNFAPSVGTLYDQDDPGVALTVGNPSVDALFSKYRIERMWRIVDDGTLAMLKVVPDLYRLVVLEGPPETDVLAMMREFDASPFVSSSEPDLIRRALDRIPNDALWNSQWDKELMRCPRAWDFTTGTREIFACAIDLGIYWEHPDLYDNLWVNPGEDLDGDGVPYTPGEGYPGDQDDINGVDDDGNGKVDDLIAWDFTRRRSGCAAGEDCDGQEDNNPYSVNDHGTHTAGLLGAVGNNDVGVAGVNWFITVIANRTGFATPDGGSFEVSATVSGMYWAVAHGAQIISMSYGSYSQSSEERNAIQNAWNNGVALFGATGNDHRTTPLYPAAHANVVSVGSTDSDDGLSEYTNYGTWVDCYSPGNMVMSLSIPGYITHPGTSMACPNAAGIFALMWSIFPDMTNAELVDFVLDHCVDIRAANPSYDPNHLGRGRVDAQLPLQSELPYLTVTGSAVHGDNDNDGRLETGESANLTFTLANDAEWSTGENIEVIVSTTDPALTLANTQIFLGAIAPGASVENTGSPVQVTVGDASIPHWAVFDLHVIGDNGVNIWRSFAMRVGRPQILIVGDDGSGNYRTFFTSALLDTSVDRYNHDLWLVPYDGELVAADVAEYGIIIWVCGNEGANTLTADNQAMLAQFLDSGKKVLVAGQNIDEDISGSPFYANYLHAQHVDGVGERNVNGVTGDPLSDGTTLLLVGGGCGGNGSVSPSKIAPVGGGVSFYEYAQGGSGAVRFENSTYKMAYFSFAIEAACGLSRTTHHRVVLQRIMQWFGAIVEDAEESIPASVPAGFALKANYPNPFNATTMITFEVPTPTRAMLKVYDLLGRQVAVLLDRTVHAGSHEVTFDGSDLSSGVYLVHLQADGFSATQRMVLIK